MALSTSYQFADLSHFNRVQLIHDTVMGGRSSGSMRRLPEQAGLNFYGDLSLANNGGFASVEFSLANPLPAKAFNQIMLQVAGDNRQYQLRLKTPYIPGGVAYVANFTAKEGITTVVFNERDFRGQFRGSAVRNMPVLRFQDVTRFSIMLADKTPGMFSIDLHAIAFADLQSI